MSTTSLSLTPSVNDRAILVIGPVPDHDLLHDSARHAVGSSGPLRSDAHVSNLLCATQTLRSTNGATVIDESAVLIASIPTSRAPP
jgi:hypothetical protein